MFGEKETMERLTAKGGGWQGQQKHQSQQALIPAIWLVL